jgi:hypothetical protein
MGGGGFCRRLFPDETFRGESYSRRHPKAGIQDTTDQPHYARFVYIRGDAFSFGVAARAETGLKLVLPFEIVDRLVPSRCRAHCYRVEDNAIHLQTKRAQPR